MITGVLLLAAIAALFALWMTRVNENAGSAVIRASGTIEGTEYQISSQIGGRLVYLNTTEGTEVHKGALLARIDTRDIQQQVDAARAAVAYAQARWEEAKNGNRPEQIVQARAQLAAAEAAELGADRNLRTAARGFAKVTDLKAQQDAARSRFQAAQAAYQHAIDTLSLVKQGTRPEQKAEALAAVQASRVALEKSQSDSARMEFLYKQGAISAQQWDASRAARDSAKSQLDQASAHLSDLQSGPRPAEIGQAEMGLAEARANLEGARLAVNSALVTHADRLTPRAQYDSARAARDTAIAQVRSARASLELMLAGSRPEDLRAAGAQVQQAKSTLQLAETQLARASIYAPADAFVQTRVMELGEMASPGAPIATLVDLDQIWLRVYVSETRYGLLRLGMPAEITVDSFPGQHFRGRVEAIASEAEFTPKNVQTEEERVKFVFGVKVALDNREHRLKPGMPADASFRIH